MHKEQDQRRSREKSGDGEFDRDRHHRYESRDREDGGEGQKHIECDKDLVDMDQDCSFLGRPVRGQDLSVVPRRRGNLRPHVAVQEAESGEGDSGQEACVHQFGRVASTDEARNSPALAADLESIFWGGIAHEGMASNENKLCGCQEGLLIPRSMNHIVGNLRNQEGISAREVAQSLADPWIASEELPTPNKNEEDAPGEPNVYSDGSLLNATSMHWRVGRICVFWPGRKTRRPTFGNRGGEVHLPGARARWGTSLGCFLQPQEKLGEVRDRSRPCCHGLSKAVNIGIDNMAVIKRGQPSSSIRRARMRPSCTTRRAR